MSQPVQISECLLTVDSPDGRQRLADYLKKLPYPRYEPAGSPGLLVRIESNGKRTLGRFINRKFKPVTKKQRKA
jgi:hypothetical protein